MAFADFRASKPVCAVRSDSESDAFGLDVYRMTYPHDMQPSAAEIASELARTNSDLAIIRCSAEHVDLAAAMAAALPDRLVFFADALVYYGVSDTQLVHHDAGPHWDVREVAVNSTALRDSIREIFKGYRNHYYANPRTRDFDVASAYVDWVASPSHCRWALGAYETDGRLAGAAVVEEEGSTAEVLLAGVVPDSRRNGAYRALMQAVGARVSASSRTWVISTQVWNIAPQRTWVRLGLEPQFTVSTYHVLKRGLA